MNRTFSFEIELRYERIRKMETYLRLKTDERDWHGVADAAMDLRDLESEILGLEKAREIYESGALSG